MSMHSFLRAEMARHKHPGGPIDAKLLRGGLVDLEFVIHYLQLREGRGLTPALSEALVGLADAGLVPSSLSEAYRLMGRLLVAARLLAPEGREPPQAARAVLARACGCADWNGLLAALATARQTVAATWSATFEQELEID